MHRLMSTLQLPIRNTKAEASQREIESIIPSISFCPQQCMRELHVCRPTLSLYLCTLIHPAGEILPAKLDLLWLDVQSGKKETEAHL